MHAQNMAERMSMHIAKPIVSDFLFVGSTSITTFIQFFFKLMHNRFSTNFKNFECVRFGKTSQSKAFYRRNMRE